MPVSNSETGGDCKILVVGASGYFGKLLVAELMQQANASLILAGRRVEPLQQLISEVGSTRVDRLQSMQIDLREAQSCQTAIQSVDVVVCAAGPYQGMPLHLAQACVSQGVHYIDFSDDRQFVISARKLLENPGVGNAPQAVLCSGWSSMPSLSAVLARIASQQMAAVNAIYVQIAPGNKAPRSNATVESLLDSLGKRFAVWKDGGWNNVTGWSNPRVFQFPKPIGDHQGFLVDVPDHELFPPLFGASTVEFRVGAELPFLNLGVSYLALFTRFGIVPSWKPLTGLLQTCMSLTGTFGHDWGALGVEVLGLDEQGSAVTRRACIVADHAGQRIPVMPATIMCKKLISQPGSYSGLVALDSWIDRIELESECSTRGYRLIIDG